MENDNLSILDFALGAIIAIVYWASHVGEIFSGASDSLFGSLFALFLYFGGIIVVYVVFVLLCILCPLTRFLPCIFGGIATCLFLSMFI